MKFLLIIAAIVCVVYGDYEVEYHEEEIPAQTVLQKHHRTVRENENIYNVQYEVEQRNMNLKEKQPCPYLSSHIVRRVITGLIAEHAKKPLILDDIAKTRDIIYSRNKQSPITNVHVRKETVEKHLVE